MADKPKVLSDEFVGYVREEIIRFYLTHLMTVAGYAFAFLLNKVAPSPYWPKYFIPRHVVRNIEKILTSHTTKRLATIARLLRYDEEMCMEYYILGSGNLTEEFRELYLNDFEYTQIASIPDFFERLYVEFVKISKEPQERFWYLEEVGGTLLLRWEKEKVRIPDGSFKKAVVVSTEERRKRRFEKAKSL